MKARGRGSPSSLLREGKRPPALGGAQGAVRPLITVCILHCSPLEMLTRLSSTPFDVLISAIRQPIRHQRDRLFRNGCFLFEVAVNTNRAITRLSFAHGNNAGRHTINNKCSDSPGALRPPGSHAAAIPIQHCGTKRALCIKSDLSQNSHSALCSTEGQSAEIASVRASANRSRNPIPTHATPRCSGIGDTSAAVRDCPGRVTES